MTFLHAHATFASDDELLGAVVPFVEEGLAREEPAVLVLDDRATRLTRQALGERPACTWLPASARFRNPARTIADLGELFDELVAGGATRVRLVGTVPHPGSGGVWETWARYEAAVNRVFADRPVSCVCVYDRRTASDDVLADVRATHPLELIDGELAENPDFVDPDLFLRERHPRPFLAAEHDEPSFAATVDDPAQARDHVRSSTAGCLPSEAQHRLVLAVSEAVANAVHHGVPPAHLSLWCEEGIAVAEVSDRGRGPEDPATGLVPAHRRPGAYGGRGLWIAHQVCTDVAFDYRPEAFAVRMLVDARR